MYRQNKMIKTSLKGNPTVKGETIEQKINRIVNNKEPITDGAPLIYTDRKDGVNPDHDIRTDRFDVAIEAMEKVSQVKINQRKARIDAQMKKEKGEPIDPPKNEAKGQSTAGTEGEK